MRNEPSGTERQAPTYTAARGRSRSADVAPTEAVEREPDVLLDVPELTVEELSLAVDGLAVDLSLRARLANLLEVDAGVRVHVTALELDVKGVRADVLLKVQLERLAEILERTLDSLDRNPQLVELLTNVTGPTLREAAGTAVPRGPGGAVGRGTTPVDLTGEVTGDLVQKGRAELGQPAVQRGDVTREVRHRNPAPESEQDARAGRGDQAEPPTVRAEQTPPAAKPPEPAPAQVRDQAAERAAQVRDQAAERAAQARHQAAERAAQVRDQAAQAADSLRQVGRMVWDSVQSSLGRYRSQQQSGPDSPK